MTHTPPALRWVALFLAACAVLGLFLGFRDQIRKNPPGWYTGAEQIATPLPAATDGAREAVAFDPTAARPSAPQPTASAAAPAPKAESTTPETTEAATLDPAAAAKPATTAKPKPTTPPARAAQPADPVGDILEGQKEAEPAAPPTVPY